METYKVVSQRIDNGGLVTYSVVLPIVDALGILEIPDPGRPFPGNRRVNKKHAMEFGNYWEREPSNWIVPPILIDSEAVIKAEPVGERSSGEDFYNLHLPMDNFGSLKILDGQHRVLGWYLKRLELDVRKSDATSSYNRAIITGDKTAAQIAIQEISHVEEVSKRLENEKISVNIIDSLDDKRHQQFFVDIAKNALGINKTVQAKFDNSSVINRVTQYLIKTHPMLVDHVDLEKTTCSGTNVNLLSVVNVADIVRHVCFGITSRVTAKKESIYSDEEVSAVGKIFFDLMLENFSQVEEFHNGIISAVTLREGSLLGSGTIWRCFAGAFYEICVENNDSSGEITVGKSDLSSFSFLLQDLSEEMSLPISQRWFRTGFFPNESSKAPSSRAQDLSGMVQVLKSWATDAEL